MRRMPQSYRNGELVIVIDCSDLARSARFWAGVLGYVAGPADSPTYRSLIPGDGQGIEVLLQRHPMTSTRRTGCTWTCAPAAWRERPSGSSASARPCSPITP